MSDVGVAPAPVANEVPVNPDPVNIPTPVGPQAPDKAGDYKPENRNDSRRDSIQKAFQRAEKAEPAKPRMGHNQPPEPMERERTARPEKKDDRPGPIDLKKRPDDQPKQDARPRAEHGHFAARDATQASVTKPDTTQSQPLKGRHTALPQHAPYREPPSRMTDAAKADWHGTPETVRGDMHRMHQDFSRAYEAYRGDHEEMNSIRHYSNMAREHGTSLQRALDNYTGMENKLRNDVVGGLDLIINNLNLQTPEGRRLGLEDVAWHIVNQTPEQRQLLQSKNRAMAQSHQLQQAQQRIAALEQEHKQMQYAARFHQTRAGVDQYAAQHPRLDELAELIANEVSLGFDLDTAYRRAELLRPATQAAQTRTNGTAAQTRTPTAQTRNDRSISGAPDGGPGDGSRRRGDKPVGRREAIANAMRRVNGM